MTIPRPGNPAPPAGAAAGITVACRCGQQFRAPAQLAGKRVKCPACGGPLDVAVQPPAESAFDPLGDLAQFEQSAVAAPVPPSASSMQMGALGATSAAFGQRSPTLSISWNAGVTTGVSIGIAMLVAAGVFGGVAASTAQPNLQAVIVGCSLLGVLAVVLIVLSITGSQKTIELSSAGQGMTNCSVSKRLAFIPLGAEQFRLTSNDMICRRVETTGGAMAGLGFADAAMILLIVLCLAAGAIPGLLIWRMWWSQRSEASAHEISVEVLAQDRRGPLLLYKQGHNGSYARDPAVVRQLIAFFSASSPVKVVNY